MSPRHTQELIFGVLALTQEPSASLILLDREEDDLRPGDVADLPPHGQVLYLGESVAGRIVMGDLVFPWMTGQTAEEVEKILSSLLTDDDEP